MNICVFGLWHLGIVTATSLASLKHQVIGLDFSEETINQLQAGESPLFEPGLDVSLKEGLANNHLRFTTQPAEALANTDVVWVTFDTPIDDADHADFSFVIAQIESICPYLPDGSSVLISSQLPVGSTRAIQASFKQRFSQRQVTFAYSPENLRLGQAIQVFKEPDRIVVGVLENGKPERIAQLLQSITTHIEWMSVESAEMVKHALNAFLATSITFINEVATLCERVGADAQEVERGLKSDIRIGPRAYLHPGAAFSGGTLNRDVNFLQQIGVHHDLQIPLLNAITASNTYHSNWIYDCLQTVLGALENKTIAVLGLTYKPNTSTLRRSSAVELCNKLLAAGAIVRAHDPAIQELSGDTLESVFLCKSANEALTGTDAAVIATEWSDYEALSVTLFIEEMRDPLVIDPNNFLASTLGTDQRIHYYAVGKPYGTTQ